MNNLDIFVVSCVPTPECNIVLFNQTFGCLHKFLTSRLLVGGLQREPKVWLNETSFIL